MISGYWAKLFAWRGNGVCLAKAFRACFRAGCCVGLLRQEPRRWWGGSQTVRIPAGECGEFRWNYDAKICVGTGRLDIALSAWDSSNTRRERTVRVTANRPNGTKK